MNTAVVQKAIAFITDYYGLEGANIAAQVNAAQAGGWLVTVWIGINLYQKVNVALDGTVRRICAADGELAAELAR